jgi:hypothetical protein
MQTRLYRLQANFQPNPYPNPAHQDIRLKATIWEILVVFSISWEKGRQQRSV